MGSLKTHKMKLTNSILAMLCIAVCNSLTISKKKENYRQGRTLGDPCTVADEATDCDPTNDEVCSPAGPAMGLCVCNPDSHVEDPNNPGDCIDQPPDWGSDCTGAGTADDNCNTANGQFCVDDDNDATTATTCRCSSTYMDNLPALVTNNDDICVASRGASCSNGATPPAANQDICSLEGMECRMVDGLGFRCLCSDGFLPQPAFDGNDANTALCAPAFEGPCSDVNDPDTIPREDCTFPGQRCVDGRCQCNENFVRDADGVCQASIDAPCPNGDECTLDNQRCIDGAGNNAAGPELPGDEDTQFCGCLENFLVDPTTGTCVGGTGAACAAAANPAALGGDDLCAMGMRCYEQLAAVPPAIVGEPDFANPTPGGCADCICSCPTGLEPMFMFMLEEQMGMCVRSLGTGCGPDAPCLLTNSECSAAGECVCSAPFVDNNGVDEDAGACAAKIGAACPNGNECLLDNSACFDGDNNEVNAAGAEQTCRCTGTFGPNADNTACVPSVGADCPNNDECDLPNQVCVVTATNQPADNSAAAPAAANTQACQCAPNHAQNDAGACVASLGADCTTNNDCELPNQVCNDGKCANTIGGICTDNPGELCPLTRQECVPTEDNPAVLACACEAGWEPDANNVCNGFISGFCGQDGCGLNEGDCNSNQECTTGLCGVNNCGPERPLADCCVDPTDPTGNGAGTACDGSAPNVWGCCTPEAKCGVNQGDCDTRDDCGLNADGVQLECVADSCTGDGFAGIFPAGQVDCCQEPETAKFYSNFVDGIDKRIERWTNDEEPVMPRPKY